MEIKESPIFKFQNKLMIQFTIAFQWKLKNLPLLISRGRIMIQGCAIISNYTKES